MGNTILAMLKVVDGVGFVDVDDQGSGGNHGNRVHSDRARQRITWKLSGKLANADFQAMTDTPPGFRWITAPPPGVFSPAVISRGGRKLEIRDAHTGLASAGTWNYQLAVRHKGKLYLSLAGTLPTPDPRQGKAGPIGTIKDPVIINKER